MKRLVLIILIALTAKLAANPSFTIGSNYYLTVFAYPHDILHWPGRAVYINYNPQTLPWQGDVTDIARRPSESYVNNYQNVEFAPPDEYTGNPNDLRSWMRMSSYAYKKNFTLGGLYSTKFGKFLVELGNTSVTLELDAEGTGRASEEAGTATAYHLVPFKAQTRAGKDDYNFKLLYANRLFSVPIGLKLDYVKKTSGQPKGFLQFKKDDQTYQLSHLTWGWATIGCAHIFGYSHINTDALFQDSYTLFDGHQLDLQASFEIDGNYKSGIRYRTSSEDGETYQWKYLEGSEFVGAYQADPYWKDRRESELLRGYTKARFWRNENSDAGILFFLQRATNLATPVNKLSESDQSSAEKETEITLETNPYVNARFRGGYLDFGWLVELSYARMANTSNRWNNVSHSEQPDVFWDTSPYIGWSQSWERFSKGSRWFFATGFEAYSSVQLHKRLSLLLRLLALRKYTFREKLYGQSTVPAGSSSYQFYRSHERDDYLKETWMTGSIGFSYGFGPMQMLFDLQLPLAYLKLQETALSDNKSVLFEHEIRNMWQVQEPITFRLLLVYALSR
jgi:hypothetical protein